MSRVWLIGESNPYGADPRYALYPLPKHASGGRLARILGMGEDEYLAAFERRNLLTGDKWSAPRAREADATLLRDTAPGDRLVFLGTKVAAAFGVDYKTHLCEPSRLVMGPDAKGRAALIFYVVIPHPSGLNRAWADPALAPRVRAAVEQLRSATSEAA